MSSFVRKLMATGAAFSIGISSYAVADYTYNYANNNFGGNYCPPICEPGCANWCDNLSFNAAWLYWKASGDDYQYAVDRTRFISGTAGTAGNIFSSDEKYHHVDFDWDNGFRLGLGLALPYKGWGVDVVWTHYDTSSSSKTSVAGDTPATVGAGFPVLGFFTTSPLAVGDTVDFRGAVKFRYNTVDIELGKWLNCCNDCVTFRPHIGFRLADIQERFKDSVTTSTTGTFSGYTAANFHHENRFKGMGVRIGLDTDLCLCDGWSIIGRGAASAIWGTAHYKNITRLSTSTIVDVENSRIKEDFHQVRFISDLSVGIRWKTCACGCYPVLVEALWEHHYLFHQHRYWVDDNYDSATPSSGWKSQGDVALQGLTLSFIVDF